MAIKYTEEQLNSIDKSLLVQMFLNQQEQPETLTKEVHSLNDKLQNIMEQIVLSNKNRFGRSSEQMIDSHQIRFMEVDGNIVFFNEAEAVCDLEKEEPEEHHIGVYVSKSDEHFVRAGHSASLLPGSPVSPSLATAIMNGKYVNAVPLYRLEKEFERYGLAISRQTMANWLIFLRKTDLSSDK